MCGLLGLLRQFAAGRLGVDLGGGDVAVLGHPW
jgi:hypothetical protein